ncbi:hypothetical protein ACVIJW_001209 [Bradyrhizobium barranii subsp. barranii]
MGVHPSSWAFGSDGLAGSLRSWPKSRAPQSSAQLSSLAPVGRSKSPGYGHLKLPHLMIAVSAAEQQ